MERQQPQKRSRLLIGIPLILILAFLLLAAADVTARQIEERDCLHCHDREVTVAGWSISPHRELDCISCHGEGTRLARLGERMDSLTRQVQFAVGAAVEPPDLCQVSDATCERCHRNPAVGEPEDLRVRPAHELHLAELDLGCLECHSPVVHLPSVEEAEEARMNACLNCHEEQQAIVLVDGDLPGTTCLECHNDVQNTLPENHLADSWLSQHGPAGDSGDCAQCHRYTPGAWPMDSAGGTELVSSSSGGRDFCLDCHRVPVPHGDPWLSTHGEAAREDAQVCLTCHGPAEGIEGGDPLATLLEDPACAACHTVPLPHESGFERNHGQVRAELLESCRNCHSAANWITPDAIYAADDFCTTCHLTRNPHPDSWFSLHGGAVEDRGLDSCHTCHDEQRDCSSCHGKETWHPAQWPLIHGRIALQGGLEECRRCHTDPKECVTCHNVRRPQ